MTTRQSFGISKAIIDKLLPLMATNPSEACSFFAHDAIFTWASKEITHNIVGKHSIYNFLQEMQPFNYVIQTYDTHSILSDPAITSLVVTGKLVFSSKEKYQFHIASHIVEVDNGRSAIVKTFSMKY